MFNSIRYIWSLIKFLYFAVISVIVLFVTYMDVRLISSTLCDINSQYIKSHSKVAISIINFNNAINNIEKKYLSWDKLLDTGLTLIQILFVLFLFIYVSKIWKLYVKYLWKVDTRSFLDQEQNIFQKINTYLQRAIDKSNLLSNKKLNIGMFKIRFNSSDEANIWIYSDKTITVTNGFIQKYINDPETFEGVLLHELGHVINGDLHNNEISLATDLITRVWSYWLLMIKNLFNTKLLLFMNFLTNVTNKFSIMAIFVFPFILFYLFLTLFIFIPSAIIFLIILFLQVGIVDPINLLFGKLSEHRADNYACRAGGSNGLLKFLYDELKNESSKQSIMSWIYSTHPLSYNRIKRIEKYNRKNNIMI